MNRGGVHGPAAAGSVGAAAGQGEAQARPRRVHTAACCAVIQRQLLQGLQGVGLRVQGIRGRCKPGCRELVRCLQAPAAAGRQLQGCPPLQRLFLWQLPPACTCSAWWSPSCMMGTSAAPSLIRLRRECGWREVSRRERRRLRRGGQGGRQAGVKFECMAGGRGPGGPGGRKPRGRSWRARRGRRAVGQRKRCAAAFSDSCRRC